MGAAAEAVGDGEPVGDNVGVGLGGSAGVGDGEAGASRGAAETTDAVGVDDHTPYTTSVDSTPPRRPDREDYSQRDRAGASRATDLDNPEISGDGQACGSAPYPGVRRSFQPRPERAISTHFRASRSV
ncbi:hypothetical protein FDG2_3576 [Candidatus Protofrankia californiensis]|uniref:Uncharacterized protein n=1 Tax=Candidatus Protofrankia californiensis TaxID=1839754 RepID=A0A1C3NZY8_9ACTN|nr:hypothetical protein FDG2_3576 [Candidatus Protofrankia californiensis]